MFLGQYFVKYDVFWSYFHQLIEITYHTTVLDEGIGQIMLYYVAFLSDSDLT